jgi:hypothetical protein
VALIEPQGNHLNENIPVNNCDDNQEPFVRKVLMAALDDGLLDIPGSYKEKSL